MRFIKFQSQVERCGTRFVRAKTGNSASWYSPLARAPSQTSARLACSFLFQRFFEIFFNPLVKIKLLSYNTYATEKNNSTKRISRQVGIR